SRLVIRCFLDSNQSIHKRIEQIKLANVNPSDFVSVGNIVYLLDRGNRTLVGISVFGGDAATMSYEGIVSDPVALAANDSFLVFADQKEKTFLIFERVIPATIVFEDPGASDRLVMFYKYLNRRNLLPT